MRESCEERLIGRVRLKQTLFRRQNRAAARSSMPRACQQNATQESNSPIPALAQDNHLWFPVASRSTAKEIRNARHQREIPLQEARDRQPLSEPSSSFRRSWLVVGTARTTLRPSVMGTSVRRGRSQPEPAGRIDRYAIRSCNGRGNWRKRYGIATRRLSPAGPTSRSEYSILENTPK